jgi:hypothetical protein
MHAAPAVAAPTTDETPFQPPPFALVFSTAVQREHPRCVWGATRAELCLHLQNVFLQKKQKDWKNPNTTIFIFNCQTVLSCVCVTRVCVNSYNAV